MSTVISIPQARPVHRRSALKSIVGLAIVAGGAWATVDQLPIGGLAADYRTGVAERRTIRLDDGTAVTLNAGSAIDVLVNAGQTAIRFLQGEVLVACDGERGGHPVTVTTRHGTIVASGARLIVGDAIGGPGRRPRDVPIAVSVLGGSARIALGGGGGTVAPLDAGQRTVFTEAAIAAAEPAGVDAGAWVNGMLVADRMPLPRLLRELARYRHGVLRADPALAGLTVSASFPLDNPDAALNVLQQTLPVRVRAVTPYWITVLPA